MITPENYNEYSQHIRVNQDLRGEAREVIELWSLDKQKQKKYQGQTPMGIFMNPIIEYS